MKWLCYSCLSVFATAKWFLSTWLALWKIPDTAQVCYAAIIRHTQTNYAPFSLSASIHFHQPLWAGVDIGEGERETVTSGPLFSEMPRALFESFALTFCLVFFSVIDQISQFSHNFRKGRLVNTISSSFNTIRRQMTERSHEKTSFCIVLFKNLMNYSTATFNKIWSKS